jgi:hypothetical protein
LGWGSTGKAFFGSFQVSRKMQFNVTMRCSIVPLRSTGQLLSRVFVVLLRKSIPQSRNLKAAAELNVKLYERKHESIFRTFLFYGSSGHGV